MTRKGSARAKPIEHPDPTPATVKQLYATAFACGKPGCRAPLYRVSDDTGKQILNSRVAHIHARSEGGPRWDPNMSAADNRSLANLLPLCLFHASEIDEFPSHYPAELLREWKRRQLAEHERALKHWQMTDAEAQEAISPVDLAAAFEKLAQILPFTSVMRTRADALKLAARESRGRQMTRLAVVSADRRDAVVEWIALEDHPTINVPPGQVRLLVARMGAGKSELAGRWWDDGLQDAARDEDVEIPLYFAANRIVRSLQSEVIAAINGDPHRECRILIDNLHGVSPNEGMRLLTEARQLVRVWPRVSVLMTTRPGIPVPEEDAIDVPAWPVERGARLLRAATGQDNDLRPRWNAETRDLLTSPLTTLALARRLRAGRDVAVSRVQLLADLAHMVIGTERR